MNNDLGLLHPCEVAIVEEMLDVATHFRKITAFCDAFDGGSVEPGMCLVKMIIDAVLDIIARTLRVYMAYIRKWDTNFLGLLY